MQALSVLIFLALVGASGVAHAQTPDMETLNERGFEKFHQGKFEEAAELFHQAAAHTEHPEPRKNEAIAWFKAERCEKALAAARSFLADERVLEADARDARAIIANCKTRMARTALEARNIRLATRLLHEAEEVGPDQYTRDQITALWVEIETLVAQTQAQPEQPAQVEPPQAVESREVATRGHDVLGWTVLSSGAALLIGTGAYHALMLNRQDEFVGMAANGGDPERFDQLARQISVARWLVPTLYVAGTAAVGAGGALLLLSPAPAVEASDGQLSLRVQMFMRF